MLRALSLEQLIEQCRQEPSLAGWAAQFRRRYLDLSPIGDHVRVPTPDAKVQRLAEHCRAVLGDLTVLPDPPGYPDSLALCVLDAIWSMGVRYTAVKRVISRYRADLQAATRTGQAEHVEAIWRTAPGQRSGISWRYLLMLAGVAEVKPDWMIRRFVADALHLSQVDAETAARLVTQVQRGTPGVSLRALDHAIWQYQRTVGRPGGRTARPGG